MTEIAKLYLEMGIIKDLYERKVISEEVMNVAIIELKRKINLEEEK